MMNLRSALSSMALLSLSLAAAHASSVSTFDNTAAITIPNFGNASIYPSNIIVSGVSSFTRMEVRLNGFSHTFPNDVDILVVSSGGSGRS